MSWQRQKLRAIRLGIDGVFSRVAVKRRYGGSRASQSSPVRACDTLVIGSGPAESLGDQALTFGTVCLATDIGANVTSLVLGTESKWKSLGLEDFELVERYANIRTGKINSNGISRFSNANLLALGADTIEGKYDHAFLAMRVAALNIAASSGKHAGLVNFSMSDHPTKLSLHILEHLHPEVDMWARDRDSQDRARSFLNREVKLAPDIALFIEPVYSDNLQQILNRASNSRMVVLVPNSLMAEMAFGRDYGQLMTFWCQLAEALSSEYRIIFMPHDLRAKPDDQYFCRQIVSRLSGQGVDCELFTTDSSREAKALLMAASATISGRMHACVAALSEGTPTIGLSYLQKFRGQFEWYGSRGTSLDFDDSMNTNDVLRSLRELLERRERVDRVVDAKVMRTELLRPYWLAFLGPEE